MTPGMATTVSGFVMVMVENMYIATGNATNHQKTVSGFVMAEIATGNATNHQKTVSGFVIGLAIAGGYAEGIKDE